MLVASVFLTNMQQNQSFKLSKQYSHLFLRLTFSLLGIVCNSHAFFLNLRILLHVKKTQNEMNFV